MENNTHSTVNKKQEMELEKGKGKVTEEKKNKYNAVTLELLQVTPSQDAPQGSSDSSQVGGVFCHESFRDWRAAAARTAPIKLIAQLII